MNITLEGTPTLSALGGLGLVILLSYYYLFYRRREVFERRLGTHALGDPAAKIVKLFIHPIKSCKGISVDEIRDITQDDRTFVIVDARTDRMVTARKVPKMVLIDCKITHNEGVDYAGYLQVSFPPESRCPPFDVPLRPTRRLAKDWQHLDSVDIWGYKADAYICRALVESGSPKKNLWNPFYQNAPKFHQADSPSSPSSILSKYMGYPVHLAYKGQRIRPVKGTQSHPNLSKEHEVRFQDGYPFLVASMESLLAVQGVIRRMSYTQELEASWKTATLAIERFRPNIVVSDCKGPFEEDNWSSVAFGSGAKNRFDLVSKCGRCLLPNVDVITGVKDSVMPMAALQSFRRVDKLNPDEVCFGCNAIALGTGVLRIGDKVYETHNPSS